MMAGWADVRILLEQELQQSVEEGKDQVRVDQLGNRLTGLSTESEVASLHAELLALPVNKDFPFIEPDTLPEIRALCPEAPEPTVFETTYLADSMHGAWIGRAVGCALGKPVEGFMLPRGSLASWQRQRAYLQAISPDEWPIRGYIPGSSPAAALTGETWCPASTREHIAFMETDDDIRYTVLSQMILARYGLGFTSADVARTWLDRLPYNWVCTAETQAYRNLVMHYDSVRDQEPTFAPSPQDIDWKVVATVLNPYREWIGAQIRVDSYAYAVPGRPRLAAELAFRDARISHVKNGIYGAMLCAAMIAQAFVVSDVRQVIEAGLAEIPATCRLHAAVRKTISICERHHTDFTRFEDVIEDLYAAFGAYHPTHTINNAAVVVASLLLSGGDFHRAVTFAVMAGWDTDCNGATVGSIVGALNGSSSIPKSWSAPLNDTLQSQLAGYHPIAISECAQRSLLLAHHGDDAPPLGQAWW